MKLRDLISEQTVLFLEPTDRDSILQKLTERAGELMLVPDERAFRGAILDREKTVSTGIGLGVAVPHAKLEDIRDFFIVLGIVGGGVNWDAIDQKPVSLVFMIGGPANKQDEYLRILAKVVLVTKNGRLRDALRKAGGINAVLSVLSEI